MYATIDAVQIYAKTMVEFMVNTGNFAPIIIALKKRTIPPDNCEMPVIQKGELPCADFYHRE